MHMCECTHAHACAHTLTFLFPTHSPLPGWALAQPPPHKALFPDLCYTCPLSLSQLNMPPLRKANCAPPPPKWFLLRSSVV